MRRSSRKPSLLLLLPALLLLSLFTGCAPVGNGNSNGASSSSAQASVQSEADRVRIEAYIRANIATIAPEKPTLGGTFHVTAITWSGDKAIVDYEDGHQAFTAEVEARVSGDIIVAGSARTITKPQAGAKEGEFCGGIAAIQCASGLSCKYDGTYPDAGGKCVKM